MSWYKRAAVWVLWPIVYTAGWVDGYFRALLNQWRKPHE